MRNISKKTMELMKESVKIDDLFEWLGAVVIRRNHRATAFCPFCDDSKSRNPGCSLDLENNLYHCFVCGAGGDIISAVQEHSGSSFPSAVEQICNAFSIPIEYDGEQTIEDTKKDRMRLALEAANKIFIEQRVNERFETFKEERKLSEETVEKWEIGLSLYSKAEETVKALLEQGFSPEELCDSGICYDASANNQKPRGGSANQEATSASAPAAALVLSVKNRITFPIRKANGSIVGFGARDITGKSPAKYKNTKETELFKKREELYGADKARKAIARNRCAIVCEGYMDTISFHANGVNNAVGVLGTALTEKNLSILSKLSGNICLFLDNDAAGVSAAMRTVESADKLSASVRVASLDPARGKDPDEFFRNGGTPKEIKEMVAGAKDIHLFCLEHLIASKATAFRAALAAGDLDRAMNEKEEGLSVAREFFEKHPSPRLLTRSRMASVVIEKFDVATVPEALCAEWGVREAKSTAMGSEAALRVMEKTVAKGRGSKEEAIVAMLFFSPGLLPVLMSKEPVISVEGFPKDVRGCFHSELAGRLFDSIRERVERGEPTKNVFDGLDLIEKQELSRIVGESAGKNGGAVFDDGEAHRLCLRMKTDELKSMISIEANLPSPSPMKLLQMKLELGKLLSVGGCESGKN